MKRDQSSVFREAEEQWRRCGGGEDDERLAMGGAHTLSDSFARNST